MRDRRDPWKWPVSIGMALTLTLAVGLWLPRSWLGFLLSPPVPTTRIEGQTHRRWQTILPPPVVEVADPTLRPAPPDRPAPRPLRQDPRWWSEGWVVSAAEDKALFVAPVPTAADTIRLVLAELGLGVDFMTRARPDSVLAARLFMLQLEDNLRFDELKPYLTQLGRAKAYGDIISRVADMYDEPLRQEIQVPD